MIAHDSARHKHGKDKHLGKTRNKNKTQDKTHIRHFDFSSCTSSLACTVYRSRAATYTYTTFNMIPKIQTTHARAPTRNSKVPFRAQRGRKPGQKTHKRATSPPQKNTTVFAGPSSLMPFNRHLSHKPFITAPQRFTNLLVRFECFSGWYRSCSASLNTAE